MANLPFQGCFHSLPCLPLSELSACSISRSYLTTYSSIIYCAFHRAVCYPRSRNCSSTRPRGAWQLSFRCDFYQRLPGQYLGIQTEPVLGGFTRKQTLTNTLLSIEVQRISHYRHGLASDATRLLISASCHDFSGKRAWLCGLYWGKISRILNATYLYT